MKLFLFLLFLISKNIYPFKIEVIDIIDKKAFISIAVFDHEEGFPYDGEKSVFQWRGPPEKTEKGISTNLPDGNYAIVIFQDIDGNGDLTRWFFGKPKEPYGLFKALEKPKKKPTFLKFSTKISHDQILKIKLWEP